MAVKLYDEVQELASAKRVSLVKSSHQSFFFNDTPDPEVEPVIHVDLPHWKGSPAWVDPWEELQKEIESCFPSYDWEEEIETMMYLRGCDRDFAVQLLIEEGPD